MMTNYVPAPTIAAVSPGGIIGYSRGPRRIDLRRSRVFANAGIVEEEQALARADVSRRGKVILNTFVVEKVCARAAAARRLRPAQTTGRRLTQRDHAELAAYAKELMSGRHDARLLRERSSRRGA